MQAIDEAVLRIMYAWSGDALVRTSASIVTAFGGARVLVPLTIVVAICLFAVDHRRRAALLLAIVLAGRALVELLKLAIDRPRPSASGHLAEVFSQSLPSGHAANSMIVYLALALVAAPVLTGSRWPVVLAIAATVLIGLTRPVLGVHWPSDVVAGWAMGLAWTTAAVRLSKGWIGGDPRTAPVPISR